MASLAARAMRSRGVQAIHREAGPPALNVMVWWSVRRTMSAFDDKGRVLGEEERSREAVYMKQKEAELLDKLRKQAEKLEEIKRALAEYKKGQNSLEKWVHDSMLENKEHV